MLVKALSPSQEKAVKVFDSFLDDKTAWILAYWGPMGCGKTVLLSWLAENNCTSRHVPYAFLSLDPYKFDIDELFPALLEAPSISKFLSPNLLTAFQGNNQSALAQLNNIPIKIAAQEMYDSPYGNQTMGTVNNADKVMRSVERHFEKYIAETWLNVIKALGTQRVVFLFDDYQILQQQTHRENLSLLLNILGRAHQFLPNLRIVVASRECLQVPGPWEALHIATSFRLEFPNNY